MAKPSPMITLLTDFGTSDHFAGAMKGVIATIAPQTTVVDITHEVEPYRITQGRFLLAQSWPYFPAGTIHVAIVDPGVGSTRRPLLVESGEHFFVGPDNGLLGDLIQSPGAITRVIANQDLCLSTFSATFHGRDIFAPVAAHLSAGVDPASVGPEYRDALQGAGWAPVRTSKRTWSGEVLHTDRFGNLITNFSSAEFGSPDRHFWINVGFRELNRIAASYSDGPMGEPVIVAGSSGFLEIAFNQESAAKRLGLGTGAPIEYTFE